MPLRHLRLFIYTFNVLWTVLLIGSYAWILHADDDEILRLAKIEAEASYNKDVLYRLWAAGHGGVYAPVTVTNPPNLYLKHIPERDITTPSGRKLTLINPAYMTRQVFEMSEERYGIKGHITSLNPIRPENEPDEWERSALLEFEQGKERVFSVEFIDGEPYLRFMGRFITEEACLKCHAAQGYRVGDVRGGISTSVPLTPYFQIASIRTARITPVLFSVWFLGILLFNYGATTLKRQMKLQEQTERALSESEERWRTIVNSEPECVKLLDESGCVLEMNPAGLALIDATFEQVRGEKMRDLVAPQDREKFDAMVASVFNGETASLVFEATGLSGKKIILETTSVPLWDDPGKKNKVRALLSVTRDITKRKQAEDQLEEQTRILNKSQEISHIGSWHFDIVNNVLTWSDEQFRIFGRTPRDFGATYEAFLDSIHPDDRERVQATYAGAVATNRPYECIYRIIRPDGESRVILEKSEEIVDPHGKSVHSFGYSQDITELHLAEQEKAELESQLRQAYKMEALGTIAGGIAHDFNNILGIILGNAEMAQVAIHPGTRAQHNIDAILAAAGRAKDLVKQILAFSRREESRKKPYYLCRLVDDSMKSIRQTIPASVDVQLHLPGKCRENSTDYRPVLVDPTQIHQILLNLCINAVQAMDEKGVLAIRLSETTFGDAIPVNRTGLAPGTYEYLSVSDTGSGMSPEIKKQIFEPFFTTKKVGEGTGMGLAVVHGIVEGHGGKIFVESTPGKGTTFHLYFPVTTEQPELIRRQEEYLPIGNERILFVDDEKMLTDIGKELIEFQGYSVTAMTDSVEALALFKENPDQFDLVITDQTMPKMTGTELAEQILQLKPAMPIILCTGYSSKVDKEKASRIGISEFASKPLERVTIVKLIREVLDAQIV